MGEGSARTTCPWLAYGRSQFSRTSPTKHEGTSTCYIQQRPSVSLASPQFSVDTLQIIVDKIPSNLVKYNWILQRSISQLILSYAGRYLCLHFCPKSKKEILDAEKSWTFESQRLRRKFEKQPSQTNVNGALASISWPSDPLYLTPFTTPSFSINPNTVACSSFTLFKTTNPTRTLVKVK